MQLLLQFGGDVTLIHPEKGTPLHFAKARNNEDHIKVLEGAGAPDVAPPTKEEVKVEAVKVPEEGERAKELPIRRQPTIQEIMKSPNPDQVNKDWSEFTAEKERLFKALLAPVAAGDLETVEKWLAYHEANLPEILVPNSPGGDYMAIRYGVLIF